MSGNQKSEVRSQKSEVRYLKSELGDLDSEGSILGLEACAYIIDVEDNGIYVNRPTDNKFHKSLHGLSRSLIANMVEGVTKGFEKTLEIEGVGYRAQKQGKKLVLNVGYSHPVEIEEPADIQIDVPAPNKIIVKGIDKQKVGAFAGNIKAVRPPEP